MRCLPMTLRTMFMGNLSWPAATGVCVVNTHLLRTASMCWGLILLPPDPAHLLVEQLENEKRRMAFVHVEAVDLLVAERAKHADAADAEHILLAEAIMLIAAVEVLAQAPILLVVARDVGIEVDHRDDAPRNPHGVISPGADLDFPFLDDDRDAGSERLEAFAHVPRLRRFDLVALGVQFLMKVSLARQQGDGDHGHLHIRGRANRIAGQDAQSSAVGGDIRLESDLHGEVGNGCSVEGRGSVQTRYVVSVSPSRLLGHTQKLPVCPCDRESTLCRRRRVSNTQRFAAIGFHSSHGRPRHRQSGGH